MRDVEDGCIVLLHSHGRMAVVPDAKLDEGEVHFVVDEPALISFRAHSPIDAAWLLSVIDGLLADGFDPHRAFVSQIDEERLRATVSALMQPSWTLS